MTEAPAVDGGDPSVRPQDDLFGFVNGSWLATAEIPADLPVTGAFIQLVLDAEAEVGDILREAADASAAGRVEAGTAQQQIGDLFRSFLDEERVESLGTEPVRAGLDAIDAIGDTSEFARLLGELDRIGAGGLVGVFVATDDRQSDRYVVYLQQGGLGLPDEAYYRADEHAETRAAYQAHVERMLGLIGDSPEQAADAAGRIMALETRIAAGHWDNVATRDVVKSYTLMTREELVAAAPAFDWTAWISGAGVPVEAFDEVVVRQPSFLTALSEALDEVPLDDWKAWLRYHSVNSQAEFLPNTFVEESFDFYRRTLTGAQEMKLRWKRGVALADRLLGEAVGELYVAKHFPPEAKAQMDALVANLVEAYRRNIEQLDWMGEETRAKALAKLEMFRPKIGYPDKPRDYSSIVIDPADLMGNAHRAAAFETDRQFAKVGGPVDRDEWLITAQTVNAYYNPGTNEICFPAAILRPPFFDPDADPALNYGGIGAVIGHEIGHGFDDQGSEYDGAGNLVNWWTDADRDAFNERRDTLIDQYSGFEPRALPGHHVNGALTVGENIGDLGGLTIGLKAYLISLGGSDVPTVDGFTGVQQLFVNWGRVWRIKARDELAIQLLSVDVHSPAEFRANVARNLDEFHDAFGTGPGDGMWLDPGDRVRIW